MRSKATGTSERMEIVSPTAAATVAVGRTLAKSLKAGDIICLRGDLGTGKTVLAKGISAGLGVRGCGVVSPTFVLMRCYRGKLALYHFDLYRINGPEEMLGLGYEEFFFSDGVCVIEWAERLGYLAPEECLDVELAHMPEKGRRLRFRARGERYRRLLDDFRNAYLKTTKRNAPKK